MHGSELRLFNVFSYDAVLVQDSNLSPSRRQADALRVDPRSRVLIVYLTTWRFNFDRTCTSSECRPIPMTRHSSLEYWVLKSTANINYGTRTNVRLDKRQTIQTSESPLAC